MAAYLLALAYLAVDYLQPGVKFPALAPLRPALVVGGLLFLVGGFQILSRGMVPAAASRPAKLVLAMAALIGASILTAVVKQTSLGVLEVMAKMLAVCFILIHVVDSRARLRGLVWTLVLIHVWVAIDGIRSFYSPLGRAGAGSLAGILSKFLGNNNDFALALVVILPFGYFLFLHTRPALAKAALLGAVLASAAAIMSTLSRGGQLGLAAVIGAILVRSPRKGPALVTLAGCALLVAALAPDAYWERLQGVVDFDQDASAQNRLYTWRAGVEMALRNPVLGAGAGNFKNVYGRQYVGDRPPGTSGSWMEAHSVYFQLLGDLGFVGLGLFVALVFANFGVSRRLIRKGLDGEAAGEARDIVTTTALACECGLVGFLVSGAFLSAAYYPHVWYLTALLTIAQRLDAEEPAVPAGAGVTAAGPGMGPGPDPRAVFQAS